MSFSGEVLEPLAFSNANQRATIVEWMNSFLPNQSLSINALDEELRAFLEDGTVLCQILNKLKPGSIAEYDGSPKTPESCSENVKRFLAALDRFGLRRFQLSDLEKGSMKPVLDCLLTLRIHFMPNVRGYASSGACSPNQIGDDLNARWKQLGDIFHKDDRSRMSSPFQRALRSPVMSETSSATLLHHVGQKFHEVFQMKQGRYADLSATRITEMMQPNSLDNAPTQSLLSVVNGILDESTQRKNGEIPHRVACLLRKVVQEIERRISTQADHLKTLNNLFKAREDKYQSRIRVLEALAAAANDEIMEEKSPIYEKKRVEEQEMVKLAKANEDNNRVVSAVKQDLATSAKKKEDHNHEVSALKQDMATSAKVKEDHNHEVSALKQDMATSAKEKEDHSHEVSALKQDMATSANEKGDHNHEVSALKEDMATSAKEKEDHSHEVSALKQDMATLAKKKEDHNREVSALKHDLATSAKENEDRNNEILALKQDMARLLKENEDRNHEMTILKQELEIAKLRIEEYELKIEIGAKEAQQKLEEKLVEVSNQLSESKKRVKELEASSELNSQRWSKKENLYQIFSEFQLGALRELKFSSQSVKQEVVKTQKNYTEDFTRLGKEVKALQKAAGSYYTMLTENQKLHNELQELKGNIRVYCRVRPFLPGQKDKQSCIEYTGENGELIVANPSKTGKESRRSFKFNKVYGPTATQVQVYTDTQPLIQSVLDGYSVCIFAYGQTGSGKTHTMTGPDSASEEEWGVNYRALNDLFRISQTRESTFSYEILVQIVEVYNEQVRDLLTSDGSNKKLGIMSSSPQSGLSVPDASMFPVKSTTDVVDLMDMGLKNRAKGATAMNERSSRSHSIVSIHVRGVDKKTGSTMKSSLHLVDLAGSERVDRSEVLGDRLKEAQHINKSLSALGDVIFALAQKSAHVPYRNSKLTQVLQSSLGGKAKTLMFVQLNPDMISVSETLSTLKFAERVSGVELGAAKSSKDGRDVRDLMEQVASLKDTIAKKDDEIEKLKPQNAFGVNA